MPNRPRSPLLVLRLGTFVGLMLVFLAVLGGLGGIGMAELVVWLVAVLIGSLVIARQEPRQPGPS